MKARSPTPRPPMWLPVWLCVAGAVAASCLGEGQPDAGPAANDRDDASSAEAEVAPPSRSVAAAFGAGTPETLRPDAAVEGLRVTLPGTSSSYQAPLASLPDEDPSAEPVAALRPHLPVDSQLPEAFCVQVRSVDDRARAHALCEQIEHEEALPTHIFEAALPGRGTWYRICVGAEPDVRSAEARARAWSAADGQLRRFMTDVAPGHARFLIKARPALANLEPGVAQARVLLRGRPTRARPPRWVKNAHGGWLGAMTVPQEGGREAALFVAPDGTVVPLQGRGRGDCVACEEAWRDPDLSVAVLASGDVLPDPGDELLLMEHSRVGTRRLSVVTVASWGEGEVLRRESRVLATSVPGLRMWGEARLAEADGDGLQEVLLLQHEMPLADARVCALRKRSQVLDFTLEGTRTLDENLLVHEGAGPSLPSRLLALLSILDAAPDPDAASRVCAALVSGTSDPAPGRICLERVQRLLAADAPRAATQAAGLLAEASPALRSAVGPLFLRAATRLDALEGLRAHPADCAANALVADASPYDDAELARVSAERSAARHDLADLADAVFVAGLRDFGKDTPLHAVIQRWVEALQTALPARYAALQAAVLPPMRGSDGVRADGAGP